MGSCSSSGKGGASGVAALTSGVLNPKTKTDYVTRLKVIAEYGQPGYALDYSISNWEKGGKSRTYMRIEAYREYDGKLHHYQDYGYYDNKTGEYVPNREKNLGSSNIYDASGNEKITESKVSQTIAQLKKKGEV